MAKYRISIPYYRQGVLYPGGSIVEIPDDEKPSRTWTEVADAPVSPPAATQEASEPPSTPGRGRRRASDGEPTAS